MHTDNGNRGLSLMRKVLLRSFLLLLPVFLFANQAMATSKYLIIAPGQSYSTGSPPDLATPDTQVAGEQFTISIYSYDDGTNDPVNSFPQTTSLSSPATAAFNPSGAFNLPTTVGTTDNALRSGITVVLEPGSNANVAINAAIGSGGLGADVDIIPVQRIDHFNFSVLPTFNAGSSDSITIRAEDSGNNLCDAFNGTATLYAYEAGVNGATVNLGSINFSGGIYTGSHTFYHAAYARFRCYKSNSPSVDTSALFRIQAGSPAKLLAIGPGQTLRQGENGGNGRASTSETIAAQIVDSSFPMTIYACDAYWNTVTGTGNVTLTEEDGSLQNGGSTAFSGSSVSFPTVILRWVGDGTKTITATHSGAYTADTDNVPLSAGAIDHFDIAAFSGTTAGSNIAFSVTGYDQWGNTVNSVAGTTNLELRQGAVQITATNEAWTQSPDLTSGQFSGDGNYSGNINVRRAGANYFLRVTHTSVGNTDSNLFNITESTAMFYKIIMPGQTYIPGERFSGVWGRSGTPHPQQAGVAFNVSVVATDGWGNLVNLAGPLTTWDGTNTAHLTVYDKDAAVAPNPIVLSGGQAYPAFTLTEASTAQDLGVTGSLGGVTSSGAFTVYHTAVDHFAISTTLAQVAGSTYTTNITAQD
ncbi:hypothetical protein KAR34_08395, partial [bacterium]|nr:hypothetical protein [bacterium]